MVYIAIPKNGSTSFSKNPKFSVYNPTSINPMNTKLKINGPDIKLHIFTIKYGPQNRFYNPQRLPFQNRKFSTQPALFLNTIINIRL